jgi:hypothetical protein
MNKPEIDLLLKELGREPLPGPPSNFSQNVWRQIRLREAEKPQDWKSWLPDVLAFSLQPSPIVASLVIAFVIGVGENVYSSRPSHAEKSSAALSLEIFNPQTQGLTLITQR